MLSGLLIMFGVLLSIKKDFQEVKTQNAYMALAIERTIMLMKLEQSNDY